MRALLVILLLMIAVGVAAWDDLRVRADLRTCAEARDGLMQATTAGTADATRAQAGCLSRVDAGRRAGAAIERAVDTPPPAAGRPRGRLGADVLNDVVGAP